MAYPSKTSLEAIRAAAVALLERDGEAALTLRGVAAALGVVPNALYRYYATREVLVAAVADEVARRLLAALDQALAASEQDAEGTAEGRVRILVDVYGAFAGAHPSLYETFMVDRSAADLQLPHPLGHELLWQRAVGLLEPLTGRTDAASAAVTLWSLLHGLWVLERAHLLGGEKPKHVGGFATRLFLDGLASRSERREVPQTARTGP